MTEERVCKRTPRGAALLRLPALLGVVSLLLAAVPFGMPQVAGDIPISSTTVTCSPSPVAVYEVTTCTAMVSGPAPVQGEISSTNYTGLFTWSSSADGTFTVGPNNAGPYPSVCTAQEAACSVTFTPMTYSTTPITITATYGNDPDHGMSSGTFQLSLSPARVTTSTTTVTTTMTETVTAISMLDALAMVAVVGLLLALAFTLGSRLTGPRPAKPVRASDA